MIDIKKVDDIYRRYGYEIAEEDDVKVYKYTQGRYFGVDVFDYKRTHRADNIQAEYSKLGYAVLVRNYASCEEVELELFKSFFNVLLSCVIMTLQNVRRSLCLTLQSTNILSVHIVL